MTNDADFSWETIEPKGTPPYERAGHTAIISDDLMYVYGGHDAANNKLNDLIILDLTNYPMFRGVVAMNRLVNLHKGKLQFRETCSDKVPMLPGQELCPPPPPRAYHTAVLKNNFMIVFGGCPAEIEGPLYFLHLGTETWLKYVGQNSPPEVKIPRSHHTAVMNGDEMLIYGGINGVTPLGSLITFNTSKLKWSTISNNLPAIYKHSAFFNNGILYIVGGTGDHGNNNFLEIRIKDGTCIKESKYFPSLDLNLRLLTTVYDKSRDWLYIFGGFCVGDDDIECGCTDRLCIIDMAHKKAGYVYSALKNCPSPRCGHTMLLYKGDLIVFGGCDRLPLLNGEWVLCDFYNSVAKFTPPNANVDVSTLSGIVRSDQNA